MERKREFLKFGLKILFLSLLFQFGGYGVGNIIAKLPDAIYERVGTILLYGMLYLLLFGAIKLLFRTKQGNDAEGTIAEPKKRNLTALEGYQQFCKCYLFMYAGNLVGIAVSYLLNFLFGTSTENVIGTILSELDMVQIFVTVVLLAPMMEEFLFRKTIIDALEEYGDRFAVWTGALIFGLYHGNLVQFTYATMVGFALGTIYIKTHNLKVTTLIHMGLNFIGSIVGLWIMELSGGYEMLQNVTNGLLFSDHVLMIRFFGVSFAYGLFLMCLLSQGYLTWRQEKRQEGFTQSKHDANVQLVRLFTRGSMLLVVLFWVSMIVWMLLL